MPLSPLYAISFQNIALVSFVPKIHDSVYVCLYICPFIMRYLFYDKNSDIWNVPNILIRNLIQLAHSTGVSGTNKLLVTAWMYEKSVTNYPFQKET